MLARPMAHGLSSGCSAVSSHMQGIREGMTTPSIEWRRRFRSSALRFPVLASSSGEVIDGHLRLKAAQKLGMTEIPVIICDDWTEAQVKAFRLLVNRSVTWADWDPELLSLEMLDLRNLDYDIDLTGFDTHEIDELLPVAVAVLAAASFRKIQYRVH